MIGGGDRPPLMNTLRWDLIVTSESIYNEFRVSIDDELSGLRPTSDDVKEVYARFGRAYYYAEVLHRGLCNFYSLSQIPPTGPVTRTRVEEHLRTAFESTLGQLIARLEVKLPASLLQRLTVALERRNFIAHHFWYERIHMMSSPSGIEAVVAELSQDTELFCEVDTEIGKLSEPLLSRIGITLEHLTMALNEMLGGNDLEPLHGQRKPKRQETIVNVFDVPTKSGQTILIFQTEDGSLWELCDAGLGWSAYDKVDSSWPKAQKFTNLLPAKINPRPKVLAPWTFEIQFGLNANLSVQPGKASGKIIYRLTRKR